MRVPAVFGAAIVLAATQLVSAASSAAPHTLLALATVNAVPTLLHVDARTLTPIDSRSVTLEPLSSPVVRSPDNTLLAVPNGGALTFVDTLRMEKTGTLQIPSASNLGVAAWPTPHRLFAMSRNAVQVELIVVDPIERSLVARSALPEGNSTVVALPQGIAYLAWSYTEITPSKIVVVSLEGNTRSVTIDRIRSGIHWHRVKGVQVADISQPGLTADPGGQSAYLVGAKSLVAEIDLSSLAVTYHSLEPASSRRLAHVEKLLNGPTRYARWLGDGRIAVAGTNAKTVIRRNKLVKETWTPAGVAILDTRTWRSRMIDSTATWFATGDTTLLVSSAHSVKAFDTGGSLRFSTTVAEKVGYVFAFGDYVYAWGADNATILDLKTGDIVGAAPNGNLYVIGADD